jgi:hypothetical protein
MELSREGNRCNYVVPTIGASLVAACMLFRLSMPGTIQARARIRVEGA